MADLKTCSVFSSVWQDLESMIQEYGVFLATLGAETFESIDKMPEQDVTHTLSTCVRHSEVLDKLDPKHMEAAYNYLIVLICQNPSAELVDEFLEVVGNRKNPLFNLYSHLPPDSSLRFQVFVAMIKTNGSGKLLSMFLPELSRLVPAWHLDDDQGLEMFEMVSFHVKTLGHSHEDLLDLAMVCMENFEKHAETFALEALELIARSEICRVDVLVERLPRSSPLYELAAMVCAGNWKMYVDYRDKSENQLFIRKMGMGAADLESKVKWTIMVNWLEASESKRHPVEELATCMHASRDETEDMLMIAIANNVVEGSIDDVSDELELVGMGNRYLVRNQKWDLIAAKLREPIQ